jgi:aspartyl-tRNA(Asn)/glutamyl-tRNA(Gln) amidotransferase subunit C
MSFTTDQVRRLARLAHIEVTDADAERFRLELNGIFGLIEQLQAVDTSDVEPMAHAVDAVQRLREDRVTEPDCRALYQAIAPEVEAGLYLVPKVLE